MYISIFRHIYICMYVCTSIYLYIYIYILYVSIYLSTNGYFNGVELRLLALRRRCLDKSGVLPSAELEAELQRNGIVESVGAPWVPMMWKSSSKPWFLDVSRRCLRFGGLSTCQTPMTANMFGKIGEIWLLRDGFCWRMLGTMLGKCGC